MRTGRLNTKVEILQLVEGPANALNERVKTWSVWRQAYGEVVFARGREVESDGKRLYMAQVAVHFRLFEVRGITETMRLRFDGNTYDIQALRPNIVDRDVMTVEAKTQQGV